MTSKRLADFDQAAASSTRSLTMRLRKRGNCRTEKPATFQAGDVRVSLGSQTFRFRKCELRERSGYFGCFPEEEFPETFLLVQEDDANYMKRWRVVPALGIKKANNVPHDAEIFERVCDIHRIVLGLICPSCYETLAPSTSKEPNLLNDIAESIHAYQGTSEVKGFFAFTFGLDPETESPYLILEIAERMEDEKLRDRAMPHAIGQWFQETRPDMSESIRRIVSAEAEAFQRLLQKIVQEIEEILARPSTVSSIIAAHLIRKFVFVNSGSIYGLAHPVREASYQVLLLLYGTQSADAFWADHEIIALEHNERLATKLGRHGTRRDVKVSVYKVQKKVSGMLNEIQRALQPVFKEDQGLGYFTPPCHFFRWLDADLNNYASGTDDYGDDEHDTASGTEDVGMEWDSDRYDGMDDDVGEVTDTDTTWETEEDEEDEYTDAGSLSVQPSDQEVEKAARSWATKKACAPQQLALRLRATLPQSSS